MHDWKEMKKVLILIPVYNDWDSLKKLIFEINESIKNFNEFIFDCLVVNDASTKEKPKLSRPKNINSFKILNMKMNRGHARCNAFGIRHIIKYEEFDYLILMDGDGEDRPIEIQNLINKVINEPNISVVARRVERSDGYFFKFLYEIHKLITFIFTGKKMNFGNYTCLTKKDVIKISSSPSLWSSYSGTLKLNIKNLNEISSKRGPRYFGPSKMSLFSLIIHSLSIVAVFRKQVFIRSIFIFLILFFLNKFLGSIFIVLILQILLLLFNLLIFIISFRENKEHLFSCQNNLKTIENILP